MIARIFILIILVIVLPDLYFDTHYLRYRLDYKWWKRMLWWLPCVVMMVYTVCLASIRNFAPIDLTWLNVYLMIVGMLIAPKAIFAGCSSLGLLYCWLSHTRLNWGNMLAPPIIILLWFILIYGSTIGFRRLEIKHVDIYSRELPKSFDGYRIVQFSDAHVGTLNGSRQWMLQRDIDSINAQRGDMIAFTGDLQNMQPNELYPIQDIMCKLKAPDGVYSVLGNHDYSYYIKATPAIEASNEKEIISLQRQFGWTVLLNEHRAIHRGTDSIIVAGEDNYFDVKEHPRHADLKKTLTGIGSGAYVVMLQHEPAAWRNSILPSSNVQLTLSGHTHGGQVNIFGLRPTMIGDTPDKGLYLEGYRALYVTSGISGLIPFRFNVPGEITVLTLHILK